MDARRRPPVQTYRKAGPETWDLARAAYVGGTSARVVCERFGLGEANLRKKARLEGWTKRDWADARGVIDGGATSAATPAQPSASAQSPEPSAPEDLMTTVLRRARDALTAGRGSEATALLKAARDYVVISQDVERARENVATLVPSDAMSSDPQVAVLSDALIQSHLGHLWAPLTPEENIARAQAVWAAIPEDKRETLFPGMQTYLDRLGRRIG